MSLVFLKKIFVVSEFALKPKKLQTGHPRIENGQIQTAAKIQIIDQQYFITRHLLRCLHDQRTLSKPGFKLYRYGYPVCRK